jgi:DNA polymerase-1
MMLGVDRDPTAKRMNLGMLYGMGADKLAHSLGVSKAQAQEWMALYHQKFPYARQFSKKAEQVAKRRGYVRTFLGRRRRFPDSRLAHKAANAIIQGSSADITKLKMVEIDEYFASEGDHCRLMLQIHDSLSWSAPKDEKGRRNTAEADRIMTAFGESDPIHLKARLRTDQSTGSNWAEATWSPEVCESVWK